MTGIRTFRTVIIAVVSGLASVMATGEPIQAEPLRIGAPHSMKAPFQQILPMFESEYGVRVRAVYGPSKTFRRQIEKGAPVDVFLPEAFEEVETLQKKKLTLNEGPRIYAQTSLVLVMSAASRAISISLPDVVKNQAVRIALGDPKTSALGEVTARALKKGDPTYKNRFHLLYGQHGEEIVNLVHSGKADVGIVYRVDAINNGLVRIIDETPAGMPTPIQFGQAVVWTCRNGSLSSARDFFDFMLTPRIQKILLKYGFDSVSSANHSEEG